MEIEENAIVGWHSLPVEIGAIILAFTSGTSRFLSRLVCKQWRASVLPELSASQQFAVMAASEGALDLSQWARSNGCPWNTQVCAAAAAKGHLPILKWVRQHGRNWDESTTSCAAAGGHLRVLKWARTNNCAWDETTCGSRTTWTLNSFEVGKRAKLPMECPHLYCGRQEWPLCNAQVGPKERVCLGWCENLRCCCGQGTSSHVEVGKEEWVSLE